MKKVFKLRQDIPSYVAENSSWVFNLVFPGEKGMKEGETGLIFPDKYAILKGDSYVFPSISDALSSVLKTTALCTPANIRYAIYCETLMGNNQIYWIGIYIRPEIPIFKPYRFARVLVRKLNKLYHERITEADVFWR